ncbi:MAG: glycosyl transferase family 2 [Deltaproteobacteria bacterium]|jgi:glycosyltransferase involved in cell wall biosynthesis|nr:glycosyl transferase family 2 [Deltaproteobacteria bacterium]
MSVSVVVLTNNSAAHLRAALESVRWADEIIAIDGGSSDATLAILAEHAAVIHQQPRDLIDQHMGNFDVARNVGFAAARNRWILVLDSDEVVGPALRDEMFAAVTAARDVAYLIPRTNLFWGRPARLLGRDFQLRLFPKGQARYEGRYLDARPTVSCPVECLTQPLLHYQADSLAQLFSKLHRRTSQRARVLYADPAAPRESPVPLFYYMFRYYYRHQQASEDGLLGLLLSVVYALYPSLAQIKLRWLHLRHGRPAVSARLP